MQPTASVALVRGPLALRAASRLCQTPLTGPMGADASSHSSDSTRYGVRISEAIIMFEKK